MRFFLATFLSAIETASTLAAGVVAAQEEASTAQKTGESQEANTANAIVEERKPAAALNAASISAALSLDGGFVLTTDATGTVRVWNATDCS